MFGSFLLYYFPFFPSLLNELTNVLSFPSSSFCMRSKYSSLSLSSLVFDDSQKRQGIYSSSVIPRNAFAFRQGIYDVFII